MVMFCFSCPLWHLMLQVCMAAQLIAWIRCATVTLGAPPKPRISQMILDCLSGALLMLVIFNVRMTTMITWIRIGASKTSLNGPVQLLSHFLWVMFPLLGPVSSVRYVALNLCALLCVMLEYYTSTPYLLECLGLAFILVYMITLWSMARAVNHWKWHTSSLQMKYWKHPHPKIQPYLWHQANNSWQITFSNLPQMSKAITWLGHP